MCAWPAGTFFRSRRRPRTGPFRLVAAPLASAIVFLLLPWPATGTTALATGRSGLLSSQCLLLRRRLAPGTNRTACTPLGACIRARTLSSYRQVAAMADAAITADLLQALDVKRDLAAQLTLHANVAIDVLAHPVYFFF